MVKVIDIEYCGGWGYGGPALRLKKSLQAAFPNHEINTHSAHGLTGKIEVAWIEGGNKKIVWSKGKADTESKHETIIDNLKSAQWFSSGKKEIHLWWFALKSMEQIWSHWFLYPHLSNHTGGCQNVFSSFYHLDFNK